MNTADQTRPAILAFLSGKGGVGRQCWQLLLLGSFRR